MVLVVLVVVLVVALASVGELSRKETRARDGRQLSITSRGSCTTEYLHTADLGTIQTPQHPTTATQLHQWLQ